MGEKIAITGFVGLFFGFFNLIIGMPFHNPYMVFGGYGACVIFPVIAMIGITLEDI